VAGAVEDDIVGCHEETRLAALDRGVGGVSAESVRAGESTVVHSVIGGGVAAAVPIPAGTDGARTANARASRLRTRTPPVSARIVPCGCRISNYI